MKDPAEEGLAASIAISGSQVYSPKTLNGRLPLVWQLAASGLLVGQAAKWKFADGCGSQQDNLWKV